MYCYFLEEQVPDIALVETKILPMEQVKWKGINICRFLNYIFYKQSQNKTARVKLVKQ